MMDFKTDLQLFAEGEASTEDNNAGREGTQQDNESSERESVDIPDELAGVSEDIAREILAEANGAGDPESNDAGDTGKGSDYSTSTAEADSDNKQYDDDEYMPKTNVPYKRFKQQIDKNHDLEGQIKALKEQLEGYNNARSQQAQDNNQQQTQQAPAPQQPIITADVAKKMQEVVQAEAMQMTGFSKDDVEAIQWMDDDDNRKQTWELACKMAENSVQQKIVAARQQQFENSRRVLAAHNQAVMEYNNFAQAESNEPDFREVQNYAINDFFEKQSKAEQPVIAAAYQRIETNTATPQDIMLIKRYFTDAKRSYRNNHKSSSGASKMSNKFKQSKAFPRSSDIDGASVDTGSVTADTLAKMLEEKPFSEIPPEYQKMLLGY